MSADGNEPTRLTDRVFSLAGVRLAVWMAVAATTLSTLFTEAHRLALYHDEHIYYLHEEAARLSLVKYHQLPAWFPWYCGGTPGIANPQSNSLAPDFLFRLLFGTSIGRRLAIVFFTVLGMEGTYRLARRHRASALGAAFGAVVFATCGFFNNMVTLGWATFFGFQLMAWVVWCFEEGIESRGHRLLGAVFLTWMLLCGGIYTVPYTVLVLVAASAAWTVRLYTRHPRREQVPWWGAIASLLTIGVVTAGLSAVKLVPMLVLVRQFPRNWFSPEISSVPEILAKFTQPSGHTMQHANIGIAIVVLAFVGGVVDRGGAYFLGIALLFFAIAMGDFAKYAPNVLISKLPLFGQLRFPHRMVVVIALFFALSATKAVTFIEDALVKLAEAMRARASRWMVGSLGLPARTLIGFAGALLAWSVIRPIAKDAMTENTVVPGLFVTESPLTRTSEFKQSRGNRWDAQVFPALNLGSLQCFEETAFPQSPALRSDLPQEEYALDPATAKVERVKWTPNEIHLSVVADRETVVAVNQNWNAAWRASEGKVESLHGLLTVRVPAGTHGVVLRYRDRWLTAGFAVSTFTLAFVVWFGLRAARRRWETTKTTWRAMPWNDTAAPLTPPRPPPSPPHS